MTQIIVLGAAAGGGFPQWNCNCTNCQLAWQGSDRVKPRTQSSLAVSADSKHWVLLNASPDIRQQIAATPELQPRFGKRDSPISSIILTNADVDHVAGLLTLRERQRFSLYATDRVQSVLQSNPMLKVLNSDFVKREALGLDQATEICDASGNPTGIRITLFAVPGKVALYLEDETAGDNFGSVDEDTVGVAISSENSTKTIFYLPGCAAMPEWLRQKLRGSDLVFMDGTTWTNDEMAQSGTGEKTSQRMGHMSMSGVDGSLATFAKLDVKTRVFVHINNTNPVLRLDSDEYRQATAAGWIVAEDGMQFEC
jgi:pyrroloquinoline quinone biosynthesis protein B